MQQFPFTGFDAFLLALEQQYLQHDISGNICHYVITVDSDIPKSALETLLDTNDFAQQLFRLKSRKPKTFHIPHWHLDVSGEPLTVGEIISDELIPVEIRSRRLLTSEQCLSLDKVSRSNGQMSLILSWNHMLMDGYGAVLFLKRLFGVDHSSDMELLVAYEKPHYNFKTFWAATKSKFFIDHTSRLPLTMISPPKLGDDSVERTKILTFDANEVKQIDESALRCGARYGRSAFFLACSARAVKTVLENRQTKVHNFWIPVPRDNRRKGAKGPIIGNRLSFLFYRLKNKEMNSLESCVQSINGQMVDQIKSKSPDSYNQLMNFMKWLPLSLYYYLVKRRGGNSIASFLFTVAADHPRELETIMGRPVVDAMSLPAHAYPPGLTFAFMNVRETLQLMILYHTQAVSDEEYQLIEKKIKYELVTGAAFG
ncbi:hypothetical protein N6H18_03610 [Reichenbachiella agarivorans]|uniref:Condensation domain-containing protein n=1 Tax=Reichenbachiella agarivorans TaxID=2979464 RepID=A0ABY6CUK4_9BACT|nr:hypothetical protein [Reichenbachiella agarivorans]UXP33043.1 hypothetical protein N6H18_03610 [Reichenbachiella agarivorans]